MLGRVVRPLSLRLLCLFAAFAALGIQPLVVVAQFQAVPRWNEWFSFETDGSVPHARVAHMATGSSARGMLVFGGRSSRVNSWDTDKLSSLTDTWVLRSNQWERVVESDIAGSPPPRFGGSLSTIGESAYLIGGGSRTALDATMWIFDFMKTAWEKRIMMSGGPTPLPRLYHKAIVLSDETIVLVGGIDFIPPFNQNKTSALVKNPCLDAWLFNPVTQAWKKLQVANSTDPEHPCPSPLYHHAACASVDRDALYIHGGLAAAYDDSSRAWSWNTVSDTVWALNFSSYLLSPSSPSATLQWKPIIPAATTASDPIPQGRFDHDIVASASSLYAFYGRQSATSYPTHFVASFDLQARVWTSVASNGSVPQPRAGMTIIKAPTCGATSGLFWDHRGSTPEQRAVDGECDDVVLMFGGETELTQTLGLSYKDTWQFSTVTATWQRIVAFEYPTSRFGHSGANVQGAWLGNGAGGRMAEADAQQNRTSNILHAIFGGYNEIDGFLNDLWVLRSPRKGKAHALQPEWTQLVPRDDRSPTPRSGHTMVAMGLSDGVAEHLIVHGGRERATTFSPLSDTTFFNTSSELWTFVNATGCVIPRTYHVSIDLDASTFLVHGGQGYNDTVCRDDADRAAATRAQSNSEQIRECHRLGQALAFGCTPLTPNGSDEQLHSSQQSLPTERLSTQDNSQAQLHRLRKERRHPSPHTSLGEGRWGPHKTYGLFEDVRVGQFDLLSSATCNWTRLELHGDICPDEPDEVQQFVKKDGRCFPHSRSHHSGRRANLTRVVSGGSSRSMPPTLHSAHARPSHDLGSDEYKTSMVIFGGIVGPNPSQADPIDVLQLASDVWLLHLWSRGSHSNQVPSLDSSNPSLLYGTWEYVSLGALEEVPPRRWSHASTTIGLKLFISGGFSKTAVLADCWMLDLGAQRGSWRWTELQLMHTDIFVLRADHILLAARINASTPHSPTYDPLPSHLSAKETDLPSPTLSMHEGEGGSDSNITYGLLLLGGTALDIHTVDLQTVAIFQPECNPGYQSASFPLFPCTACPIGTYATRDDLLCHSCPEGLSTQIEGATAKENCTVCTPNYCHGHSCAVKDGQPRCKCPLFLSWQSRCLKLENYTVAVIAGPIGIIMIIVALHLRVRLTKKHGQLADLEDQIEELAKVWIIDETEITYMHRIDGDAPGVSSIVSKGVFRGFVVAVKKLKTNLHNDLETQQQFKKEVRLMKDLKHINIVQFIGAGRDLNGNPFIVTEYMDRGSLSVILELKKDRLSYHQLLKFAHDAASGMHYLHSHRPPFIHRDLKTANLLVHQNYTVKVSDFGTSLLMDLGRQQNSMEARHPHLHGDSTVFASLQSSSGPQVSPRPESSAGKLSADASPSNSRTPSVVKEVSEGRTNTAKVDLPWSGIEGSRSRKLHSPALSGDKEVLSSSRSRGRSDEREHTALQEEEPPTRYSLDGWEMVHAPSLSEMSRTDSTNNPGTLVNTRRKGASTAYNSSIGSQSTAAMTYTTRTGKMSVTTDQHTDRDLLVAHAVVMDENSNNYVGTPMYFSPEVWENFSFSRKSDVLPQSDAEQFLRPFSRDPWSVKHAKAGCTCWKTPRGIQYIEFPLPSSSC